MRSIRLSLVVYFLLLLGGALGAVSVIVYETTRQNLQAKQQSMAQLLRDKHQAKLDDMLLKEAQGLVKDVQVSTPPALPRDSRHFFYQMQAPVAFVTAPTLPLGYMNATVTALPWVPPQQQGPNPGPPGTFGRMRDAVHFISATVKVKVAENAYADREGRLADYFQISSNTGPVWGSPSLKGQRLPFDPGAFSGDTPFDWKFFDSSVEGSPVRVVTFKVKRNPIQNMPPFGGKGRPPWQGDPFRGVAFTFQTHFLYIQAAYDKTGADGVYGREEEDLAQDLARLEETSRATLNTLRDSLWLAGLVTFGLTLVGGFVLVRLGLRPLRRVSDAVSKVSTKDFRLPLEDGRLPSELRPIVERLRETLEMLHRTFEREKQAAADISHELRTPLAALMTTLDVALRKPRSAEEYQEILRECRESGQHMYGLVERLLMLARLDAGVDRLRPREVDVAQLAEQCASLVRPLAEARGLRLSFHKNGPASMTADPDKLREVVTNLLHNAIEYNRPEGAIDLDVRRDNGDVRVEVRDTGIGMSPESKRHIFERFYRSDPSRQAEGLHAGLGLAIVKGYVDLMGGTIDVESAPGRGSTFRVSLPAGA